MWIDVLLSAGVQVEVCRVKAKDTSGMPMKRKRSPLVGGRKDGGVAKGGFESGESEDEVGEGCEGEEDGKVEGYWEKDGKKVKIE